MKKNLIIIIFLLQAVCTTLMAGNIVIGKVMLNGNEINAEYTLNGSEAWLGSGRNACISQYSEGEVEVPATILVNGVTYPVTGVSDVAFRLCTKITSVTLPENVTSVGYFAFNGCQSLTKVSLPSTMETIGSGAFIDLPNLKEFLVKATTPPTWEYNDVFFSHEGGIGSTQAKYLGSIKLYVPEESIESYETSTFSNADLGWTTPDGWGNTESISAIETYGIDLVLDDNGTDNSTLLSEYENGEAINVMLKNRTIYMDGGWNTMCLPFSLTEEQVASHLQEGYQMLTLESASFSNGTLTLNFIGATTVGAGLPFIVKWDPALDVNASNPVFSGVTITTATPGTVDLDLGDASMGVKFKGVFDRFDIEGENRSLLYLGGGDMLYYPNATMSINAFRAYFELEGLVCGEPASNGINSFVLNFGGDATGICQIADHADQSSQWFSLDGIKITGKPTAKGIYISNGRKMIIN